MSCRFYIPVNVLAAMLVSSCVVPAWGQQPTPAGKVWAPPRTPDGQPDLQGIWDSGSLTPLERPKELGTKAFYTEAEAAAVEKSRAQELNRDRRDGSQAADAARAYNEGWFDRGIHLASNRRTSRIIDPPDGRFPPFTPAAQKKYDEIHAWFAAHPADGPEGRPLYDRCLVFSQSGPPMIPGNYNNNYQIVQNKDSVVILAEMPHQARIIPLTDRPRLPRDVVQWMDSLGHWEGDTLVVESTNFRFNEQSHFGTQYEGMSDENLRVTERLTRTGPNTILYQATVLDPTVYTKPWTIETPLEKIEGPIFEYACHEGNYALTDILAGARAQEKKAAESSKK